MYHAKSNYRDALLKNIIRSISVPENNGVISLIANSKILRYTVQPHYFHKNVFKLLMH